MPNTSVIDNTGSTARFWITIIAAFLLTLAFMVACAYLWVFVYSMVIDSTGDQAYYETYARTASPVVAVVLSFPVFFYMGRYMRRFGDRAAAGAFAVVAINLAMEVLVLAGASGGGAHLLVMSVLAALGKVLGAWQGSRP